MSTNTPKKILSGTARNEYWSIVISYDSRIAVVTFTDRLRGLLYDSYNFSGVYLNEFIPDRRSKQSSIPELETLLLACKQWSETDYHQSMLLPEFLNKMFNPETPWQCG